MESSQTNTQLFYALILSSGSTKVGVSSKNWIQKLDIAFGAQFLFPPLGQLLSVQSVTLDATVRLRKLAQPLRSRHFEIDFAELGAEPKCNSWGTAEDWRCVACRTIQRPKFKLLDKGAQTYSIYLQALFLLSPFTQIEQNMWSLNFYNELQCQRFLGVCISSPPLPKFWGGSRIQIYSFVRQVPLQFVEFFSLFCCVLLWSERARKT